MIQPVIALPLRSNLKQKVLRLVEYCRQLDGTEVLVCEIPKELDAAFIATHPTNTFFSLQAFALHREALMMKGQPFLHLEPDSIPLTAGWLKLISDAYASCGKPYLWATDSHPPGDLMGGIGVYGPHTATEIPYEFPASGWDGWMYHNIPHKIAKTPLIQHKYGIYDGLNKTRSISFPRDAALLRPDAVLFHSDPQQSLILPRVELRFAHSGCIGDTIAALPTIRQLGGGHLVMTQKNNSRLLRGPRYEFLKGVIEVQPYISSVTWEEEPEGIDVDFTNFRTIYSPQVSLARTQARYVGINDLDESPWLTVEPSQGFAGKIIVSRSSRYHNPHFPWVRFAAQYPGRVIFVGLPDEHTDFQSRAGVRLPYFPCRDSLEMAQLIAGAEAFIGNQSSPFWIAAGLGKKLVQETYHSNPDSVVARPNAFYWNNPNDSRQAFHVLKH